MTRKSAPKSASTTPKTVDADGKKMTKNIFDLNYKEKQQENLKIINDMYSLLLAIFGFYSCQECGICCKGFTPVVYDSEIKKISKYLE